MKLLGTCMICYDEKTKLQIRCAVTAWLGLQCGFFGNFAACLKLMLILVRKANRFRTNFPDPARKKVTGQCVNFRGQRSNPS